MTSVLIQVATSGSGNHRRFVPLYFLLYAVLLHINVSAEYKKECPGFATPPMGKNRIKSLFYRDVRQAENGSRKSSRTPSVFTNVRVAPPLEPVSFSSLPDCTDDLEIIHTNGNRAVERWLMNNVSSSASVLGFDLERTPPLIWDKSRRSWRRPPRPPRDGPDW